MSSHGPRRILINAVGCVLHLGVQVALRATLVLNASAARVGFVTGTSVVGAGVCFAGHVSLIRSEIGSW